MRYNGWRDSKGPVVVTGKGASLKYRNVLCEADGIKFKSKLERQRYLDLRALEHAKLVSDLQVHPRFAINWPNGSAGRPVKICDVELDFAYYDNVRKKRIFEDTKGRDNPMSQLKRKLVQAAHAIEVELVRK